MSEVSESELAYRPHLDGLRAVAVYLVVLFHAGTGWFSGGYIGVDVFFVLSGYLVTQLLLRDMNLGASIRLRRFYARRFRRLLPAAFVALLITAAVYTAIASPAEASAAVGSFKAAFLYSTNWYFIHQSTSYFGSDITTNPVLHFWSLAVEEQFYLVWPLALGGLIVLTRRLDASFRMRAVRLVVAAGALVSVAWALSLKSSDPNRAYYGTDARAYELLAGALIALVPASVDAARRFRRSLPAAAIGSMGALVLLASSLVHLDAIDRGVAVTIAACVIIVVLEAVDVSVVKRALSSRSMTYLGKISYGTYLWHWLVILVVLRIFRPSAIATAGIAMLVATALASLSFEMLERPVRMSALFDRHARAVIASGLAISVVSALVLVPRIAKPARASTGVRSSAAALLTPVPAGLNSRGAKIKFSRCLGEPGDACTVVKGKGRHLLLLGDSNAAMLRPLFTAIARREGLELSVSTGAGCPWQRDLYTRFASDPCEQHKKALYDRGIRSLHPDVVVLMNLAYESPGPLSPPLFNADGKRIDQSDMARATRQSVASLRAAGADVLLIEPIPLPIAPSPSFNPFTCLYNAKFLEQCRYRANPSTTPIERLYRQLAREDRHAFALDLDSTVCPLLPVCDPMIGGLIVKIGPTHLTTEFATSLAPAVDSYLKSVGLIPRRR